MTKTKMKITTAGLWLALILLLALPFATALTASAETGHAGAHPADAVAAEYFEEADGVYTCKSCGAQAVARVGAELYVEWAAALAAWESGETLTLLADLTGLTSTVTVSGTGKILDLNGKKLQSSVTAKAVTGDLTLRNSSTSRAVLEASSGYGILVTGTLRFTDGTLSVMGDTASIYSEGGTVAVSGGTLALLSTATDGVGLHNADATATLTVSGGTLSTRTHRRYGIHNVGTITVSGGTVDVRYNKRYAIYNEGLFTVGGGTVMAEAEDGGIYNDGTITLGGGTVFAEGTATYGRGIRNYSTLEAVAGSVLVFKDGEGQVITDALGNHTVVTVTVVKPLTVKRADGSAAVLGTDYTYGENGVLTLIGEGDYCVSLHPDVSASSHSILVDANVTLTLDGVKLHTADAAVLTVNADRTAVLKTTAAGAELKGDHNGIDNRGTLTVSGATLTVEATTGGIYNEGTLTVEDTVLSASVATAEYPDSNTVFYNRGTITLRSSRVTARGSTVPLFNSGAKSYLTVESGELSVESESANSCALENVGTVTVSGGSVSLRMAGAGSFGILSNMGTLTVEGGQLTAVGEEIDIYHRHGTLTVSGGTVDGDVQSKFSQAVIVITGGHFLGEVVIEKGSLDLRGGSFASLSVGTAVVASPGELIPNDYYAFRDGVPLNVEALVADGGYYSLGEVTVKKGADLTAFGTLTMSEGSFVYSGEAQCPTVTVTVAGRML
ncbi:MAG: carbohydrate-binding domain-containing protein, partial [Clostridia bacterium]|nr:carbohydrate-binding domain-containing protein [Clostridia bacterium]